jgi:hypothetical protein
MNGSKLDRWEWYGIISVKPATNYIGVNIAGMKKIRDQCIQAPIRHPGLKSDSWAGDFSAATGGEFEVAIRVRDHLSEYFFTCPPNSEKP